MIKIICAIIGLFLAVGLYALYATLFGFTPYDFTQTTVVGEILLLLWHVLGTLLGYVAGAAGEK